MGRTTVTIKDFGVFPDLRDEGLGDVIGGKLFTEDDGALSFHLGHSPISDYCEDDWVGTHTYVVRSRDGGATWSTPQTVSPPRVRDLTKETFWWAPHTRTREGTVLYAGPHHNDLSLRDCMLLYARREKRQAAMGRTTRWNAPPPACLANSVPA